MNEKDNIRDCWEEYKKACRNYSPCEPWVINQLVMEKKKTALERLAKRYRRFRILSLVMIPYFMFLFFRVIFFDDGAGFGIMSTNQTFSMIFFLIVILYFASAAILDSMLQHKVEDIDVLTMSVSKVQMEAYKCRKFHLQSMCGLLPACLLIVGGFVYIFSSDIYMIYGIVVGFVVGLVIGLTQFLDFMRDYKIIRKENHDD